MKQNIKSQTRSAVFSLALMLIVIFTQGCVSGGGGFNNSGGTPPVTVNYNTTVSGYLYDDAVSSPVLYAGLAASRAVIIVAEKKQYTVLTDGAGFFKADIELLNASSTVIIKFQKKDKTVVSGEYIFEKGGVYCLNSLIESGIRLKVSGDKLFTFSKVEHPDNLKIEIKKVLDERQKTATAVTRVTGRVVVTALLGGENNPATGVVNTEESPSLPIAGVLASLSSGQSATTDSNGYFNIACDLKAGNYSISFKKIGYPDKTVNFTVESKDYALASVNFFAEMESGLKSLALSKQSDNMSENSTYNLSAIKAVASYSDGATREVSVTWTASEGGINNSIFTPPAGKKGIVVLTAKYVEGAKSQTAVLTISVNALLNSLTLSKYSETIEANVPYDLRTVKTFASYSDGTTREVGVNWQTDRGSVSGFNYIPPAGYLGEANLTASYSEGGINKTAALKLIMSRVLKSIVISKNSDAMTVGSVYKLADITAVVNYSDKTSRVVTPVWAYNGTNLTDQKIFTAPAAPQIINLSASFTEDGITQKSYLELKIKPEITQLSAYSGVPGEQITISGKGFGAARGDSLVKFNQKYASDLDIKSWSDAAIVVSVPQESTPGDLIITVNQIGCDPVKFDTSYVMGISPASGTAGTVVSITGSGFGASKGSNKLKFGNIEALNIVSWSNAKIVARVPADAPNAEVYVELNGLRTNGVRFGLTSITGISPSIVKPGDKITISGYGFGVTQESSTVKFNSLATTDIIKWSDNVIETTVPAGSKTGYLTITVNGVVSNSFKYDITSISSLNPYYGPISSVIEILGDGFGDYQGTSSVSFGLVAADQITWSNTKITAAVPLGTVTGKIALKINGVDYYSDKNFEATKITSINPSTSAIGSTIDILGEGFGPSYPGAGAVKFAGADATEIVSWSGSKISVKVPQGAVSGPLNLKINSKDSNQINFSVTNITSISPLKGIIGTLVTITGSSFGTAGTVKFNGAAATEIISWTDSKIIVKVPAAATSGSVSVETAAFKNNGFSFEVLNISSVSPSTGTIGDEITINGSGFGAIQGDGSVKFGNVKAVEIIGWSDSQIIVRVPANTVTSDVTVTSGGIVSNAKNFNVILISSLSQNYGPAGMTLTVNGTGFGPAPDPAKVMFGETEAVSISLWTDSKIIVKVPQGAVSSNVRVSAAGISSNAAAFDVTLINSANPMQGTEGAQIVINGKGFGAAQGQSQVSFNGVAASEIISWSNEKITAAVPFGTSSGSVNVIIGGAPSNSVALSVISINTLSLSKATIGTQVTINGTGFGAAQGTSSIEFNGVTAATDLWTDKLIVARVPAGAVSGQVKVKTSNIVTNGVFLDVVLMNPQNPISPKYGPPGTLVTINGNVFGVSQSGGTVKFNGTAASVISKWSNTQIVAKAPAAAASGSVSVGVYGLDVTNSEAFFTVSKINSISPAFGPSGTTVTISGTGFGDAQGGSFVKFNGMTATDIISWSSTEVKVKTPLNATSGNLTVNVWGADTNGVNYKVTNITSVSPQYGPVGTPVTINGAAFGQSAGTVKFKDTFATNILSWSDNNIVAAVPDGAASGDILISVGGVDNSWSEFKVTKITSLSPQYGPAGTTVSVYGEGFGAVRGMSNISFNGVNATSIVSWTETGIVAIVPAGASSGNVKVNIGGYSSNGLNFKVTALSSVTPLYGPAGTQVTINGEAFGANSSIAGVYFNSVLAETSLWSDTKVVAIVPAGATAGDIIIKVNGIDSNGINFDATKITSATPAKGTYGTEVAISGSGFGPIKGTNKIKFNSLEANVVSWNNQQVNVLVPNGAQSGFVMAEIGGISSNSANFNVIAVSSLTPSSGTYNTNVTVNGTGFGKAQGSGKVQFNGLDASAIILWTNSQIIVQVPVGATSGGITVMDNDASVSNSFYFNILAVDSVSPPILRSGITATITGKGFGNVPSSGSVSFNGTPAASITSWNDTEIQAVVPAGVAPGNLSVTVNGIKTNNYYYDVLNITSILPNNFAKRGNQINVTGTGFGSAQGGSVVSIGGIPMNVAQGGWSNTQITATVPANAVSGNIVVRVNGVDSNPLWFEVDLGYSIASSFGSSGNGDGKFNDAGDVFKFTDSSNDTYFYVADTNNHRIQIFNEAGVMQAWIGKGDSTTGIHLPGDGQTPQSGTNQGEFNLPKGIVVDSAENIYVVDSGNSRIQKISVDGLGNTTITSWGSVGSAAGSFINPSKIALDSQNKVYVADTGNNRIQVFTAEGAHIKNIGSAGVGNGEFLSPESVFVDAAGYIYVADTGNNRIQKFNSNGSMVLKFGTAGNNNAEFLSPCDVQVDQNSSIFVVDKLNKRIQKFNSEGLFITAIGDPGDFNTPAAISLISDTKFIVSDTGTDNMKILQRLP